MKTVFTADVNEMTAQISTISKALKEHADFFEATNLQGYEAGVMLQKARTAARNLEAALAEYLKAVKHVSAGVAVAPRYNTPKIKAPYLDGGFEDLAGPVF